MKEFVQNFTVKFAFDDMRMRFRFDPNKREEDNGRLNEDKSKVTHRDTGGWTTILGDTPIPMQGSTTVTFKAEIMKDGHMLEFGFAENFNDYETYLGSQRNGFSF